MIDLLNDLEDYFDQRADADCDQDGYIPNPEMRLLMAIREERKNPLIASRIQGALDCLSQNSVHISDIAHAKSLLVDALSHWGKNE